MNRRSFFRTLATATAGFTILPSATTYSRIWKAVAVIKPVTYMPNPEWFNAPMEWRFIYTGAVISGWQIASPQLVARNAIRNPNTAMGFVPVRARADGTHIPAYIEA